MSSCPFLTGKFKPSLDKFLEESDENSKLTLENRIRSKNGSYRYLSWTISTKPESKLRYAVARDITEKRTQEIELKQFIAAIDESAIVAITDRSGKIVKANDKFCSISGYSREELIGQDHRILNSATHSKDFFKELWRRISTGQNWTGEIRNKSKDGRHYIVQTVISPLRDEVGQIDRFLSVRFDVTNQKHVDYQLEDAQRIAKLGSWSFSPITGELFMSKQLRELLRLKDESEKCSLETIINIIEPNYRSEFKSALTNALGGVDRYSFRVLVSNDNVNERWFQSVISCSKDSSNRVLAVNGAIQDISELVLAEQKAQSEHAKSLQNAKLATIGELSAGISHEINNPLAIILGYTRAISICLDDKEKVNGYLKSIDKAGDRMSKIVNGMRKYSRTSDGTKKLSNSLEQIIRDALEMMEIKSKKFAGPVEFKEGTDCKLHCDEVELGQVIMNLVSNAIDAVKSLQERWVKVEIETTAVDICIKVVDSGSGISREIEEKLFNPFFTTKPIGEGTGLGLSIVKGIVEEHKGTIEIDRTSPNTCFKIRFPLALTNKTAA